MNGRMRICVGVKIGLDRFIENADKKPQLGEISKNSILNHRVFLLHDSCPYTKNFRDIKDDRD
jgi:hypothetical protein